jgi:hypothetical protein
MSTKLRKQKIKCTKDELVAASQAGPLKCNNALQLSNLAKIKKKKKFKIKKIKKNVSAPPGLGHNKKKKLLNSTKKAKRLKKKKKKKKTVTSTPGVLACRLTAAAVPPGPGRKSTKL